MEAYVIIREICNEYEGTFTTVLGVAMTESQVRDVVVLAELEIEEARKIKQPIRPNPEGYRNSSKNEFRTQKWQIAINEYTEKLEAHKEHLKSILTVDPEIVSSIKDDRIFYDYEKVKLYND